MIILQSLASPWTIFLSLLLFKEVVGSKGLHILLQAIMFSEAFTDLSHSFPISGSKYRYENGKDITALIKLYFFLFLHYPSWKLLISLTQLWSSTQKDTSTHAEKMRELYFWFIVTISFITQKYQFSFFTKILKIQIYMMLFIYMMLIIMIRC